MLRMNPVELKVSDDGTVALPPSVLVEAGLGPGARVLAWSAADGHVVIRRFEDVADHLLRYGNLDV